MPAYKKTAPIQKARVILCSQFTVPEAEAIDDAAAQLGLSRSKLILLAVRAGIPALVAARQPPLASTAS